GEHLEDEGKAPGGAGHFDPVVGLAVREAESVAAVRVQRTVALTQVQVACIELGGMGDELSRRVALARDEALHARDELGIREVSERSENVVLHVRVVARVSDNLRMSAQQRERRTPSRQDSRDAAPTGTNASRCRLTC